MKNVFDSSAVFRAIKENKVEVLAENYTLDLARYELGNIIWKDHTLQAKISEQDAKSLIQVIRRTLCLMDVLTIDGSEQEILETSIQLKITFYDAAYVYFAKIKQARLITEDLRLIKKIGSLVEASILDNL
jgi:predicted nucleic acid-binding protein